MPETPPLTREQFLENLEKALRTLICDRLHAEADDETRSALASEVAEFVRENAAEYSLEDLVETFRSYDAALGLFYEYQDAKRLVSQRALGSRPEAAATAGLRTAGTRWKEPTTGMVFVWVPGGSFLMGSGEWDSQGRSDEKPVHEVWLDGFWMARVTVTASQYLRFAQAHPEHRPADLPEEEATGGTDRPVTGVSWHDANAFARWLSRQSGRLIRLPNEAQWEYAARSGGRPEVYAGGADVDAVAWYAGNSGARVHRVARKGPNGLGLYDMCGNVCEWCLDHYGKAAYRDHEGHNPVVRLDEDRARVVRGGSWRQGARDVRCAERGLFVAGYRAADVGFRLVRTDG